MFLFVIQDKDSKIAFLQKAVDMIGKYYSILIINPF